jgi:hypothetical protein
MSSTLSLGYGGDCDQNSIILGEANYRIRCVLCVQRLHTDAPGVIGHGRRHTV